MKATLENIKSEFDRGEITEWTLFEHLLNGVRRYPIPEILAVLDPDQLDRFKEFVFEIADQPDVPLLEINNPPPWGHPEIAKVAAHLGNR